MEVLVNKELKSLCQDCSTLILERAIDMMLHHECFTGYDDNLDVYVIESLDFEWLSRWACFEKTLNSRADDLNVLISESQNSSLTTELGEAYCNDPNDYQFQKLQIIEAWEETLNG